MSDKTTTEMYKPRVQWSTAEHVAYQQDGTTPLSPEYVALRAKALAYANLPPEPEAPASSYEGMTTEQIGSLSAEDHFRISQGGNR